MLDTIIGNYWFPGKEGIVETNNGKYKLYKYNRILLIPIKMWDDCVGKFGMSCLIYFTFYYKNGGVSDNFDSAMKYLTSSRKYAVNVHNTETGIKKEVYNTKSTAKKDEAVLSLTLQDIENSSDEERRVLESIYNRAMGLKD